MGNLVECNLAGEIEVLGVNLPEGRGGKPAVNRLSYDKVKVNTCIQNNANYVLSRSYKRGTFFNKFPS
jgi:hypothetical protein